MARRGAADTAPKGGGICACRNNLLSIGIILRPKSRRGRLQAFSQRHSQHRRRGCGGGGATSTSLACYGPLRSYILAKQRRNRVIILTCQFCTAHKVAESKKSESCSCCAPTNISGTPRNSELADLAADRRTLLVVGACDGPALGKLHNSGNSSRNSWQKPRNSSSKHGRWACEKCTVHNPQSRRICFPAMRASTPAPTLPACALDRSPLPPLIPNKSSFLFCFVAIAARERQASGARVAVSSSGLACSGWARPYHGSDASSPAHAYRNCCRVKGARVLAGKYMHCMHWH
jgi:hypothetical protein